MRKRRLKNDRTEREKKDENIRAGEVLQIVLQRSGRVRRHFIH